MKAFKSECPPDYSTYTFSYAEYAQLEQGDNLTMAYSHGYLPYTGDTSLEVPLFYKARSLRINLHAYKPSSENRRIDRKVSVHGWTMHLQEKPPWDELPDQYKALAKSYAAERFTSGQMAESRLKYVYNHPASTTIISFLNNQQLVGFVIAGLDAESVHYWFAFFVPEKMEKVPVGKWMMWKVIDWAAENNRKYAYLGTCYGHRSLYKVRDFKGGEFYDGNTWRTDIKTLKQWCKWDVRDDRMDLFKYERQAADKE